MLGRQHFLKPVFPDLPCVDTALAENTFPEPGLPSPAFKVVAFPEPGPAMGVHKPYRFVSNIRSQKRQSDTVHPAHIILRPDIRILFSLLLETSPVAILAFADLNAGIDKINAADMFAWILIQIVGCAPVTVDAYYQPSWQAHLHRR